MWWLRASERQSLIDDLIELGMTYISGLARTTDRALAAQRVLDYLGHGSFEKPWLLIYDDVQDAALFEEWRPPRGIHAIVTTRSSSIGPTTLVDLDVLPLEEAVAFLEQASSLPPTPRSEYIALAEALGCLPLALSHAASYLRSRRSSPTAYLENLSARLRQSQRPASRAGSYPNSVFASVSISLEQAATYPASTGVLRITACLAADEYTSGPVQAAAGALPLSTEAGFREFRSKSQRQFSRWNASHS